jgi:hypothetical protein
MSIISPLYRGLGHNSAYSHPIIGLRQFQRTSGVPLAYLEGGVPKFAIHGMPAASLIEERYPLLRDLKKVSVPIRPIRPVMHGGYIDPPLTFVDPPKR